ncbi:hypothetical protein VaK_0035 [Vibrio phage VaK]|nr:hypothetical protein VaK_0035 [Vibrio phage VaK]
MKRLTLKALIVKGQWQYFVGGEQVSRDFFKFQLEGAM